MSLIIINKFNPDRGFFSVYLGILCSLRELIGRKQTPTESIKIDPACFTLYGDASNWFDEKFLQSPRSEDIEHDSFHSWDIPPWASKEDLDLIEYTKYIPYNQNVKNYLKNKMPNLNKTLGVHFRGTDHLHTDRVSIETYVEKIESEWSSGKYEKIFIATDELLIIEEFQKRLTCKNIIFFDMLKSINVGLHFSNFNAEDRIRLGFEALLDSHCLSLCDFVIGKISNITCYSRILNPELKILYLDQGGQYR